MNYTKNNLKNSPRVFWSDDEILFLKNNRLTKTNKEIAQELGRTYSSVVSMSSKLGLQKLKLITIGQIFSGLTILGKSAQKGNNGMSYYSCLCKCGNTKDVLGANLQRGYTKSCGCRGAESSKKRRHPPGDTSFRHLYTRLKSNSRNRMGEKSDCQLTAEQHKEIIIQDCYYCGEKPQKYNRYLKKDGTREAGNSHRMHEDSIQRATIYVNTIDRIDSEVGYVLSNCVPCCWPCNELKSDIQELDFLKRVENIYLFQKDKK